MPYPAATAAVIAGRAINASGATAAGRSSAVTLKGSQPAAANSTPRVGSVASGSRIDFEVQLKPSAGAQAFAKAVSTPGGPSYRKFLTPAQWESRFSPTARQVAKVTTFLRSSGFKVGQVSADRMAVKASGTAAQVEHAFSTSLSCHHVNGAKLRLNDCALSVPAALAGIVLGVTGIEQTPARPLGSCCLGCHQRAAAAGLPGRAAMRQLLRPEDRHHAATVRERLSAESSVGDLRPHAVAVSQRVQPERRLGMAPESRWR